MWIACRGQTIPHKASRPHLPFGMIEGMMDMIEGGLQSPEAVSTAYILHDNVQIGRTLKTVIESNHKWVAGGCEDVPLVFHTLDHVLA